MKITRSNHSGYTLIELLLYVVIVGSFLIALSSFFITSTEARVKGESIAEVNDQGIAVMDHITQTIRNGSAITSPAAAASASALTITVPTSSLSPTIFSVSNGALQVKEGTAAAVALTNSNVQVSNVTFKNLTRSGTSGIVQISFTLTRVNNGGRTEFDYQKTFTSSAEIGW